VIRTSIRNVRSSLIHFGYEVLRAAGDQALLATGETTHIIVDKDFQRCPLPGKYLQAFGASKKSADQNR
jgi:acyl-CoA thioesterase FadM